MSLQGVCGHCQPGELVCTECAKGSECQLLLGAEEEVTDQWKSHPGCSQAGFHEKLFARLVPFEQELVAAGAQQPWHDFGWGSFMPVEGAALEHQPSWGKCLPSAGLFQSC